MNRVLDGGGKAIPENVREDLERSFGADLSDVRVHIDAPAAAESLDAAAYTHGSHIVFGEARFEPETPTGKRLLAHELAHVLQQRAGGDASPAAAEADAGSAAARAAAGAPARVGVGTAPRVALRHRKDEDGYDEGPDDHRQNKRQRQATRRMGREQKEAGRMDVEGLEDSATGTTRAVVKQIREERDATRKRGRQRGSLTQKEREDVERSFDKENEAIELDRKLLEAQRKTEEEEGGPVPSELEREAEASRRKALDLARNTKKGKVSEEVRAPSKPGTRRQVGFFRGKEISPTEVAAKIQQGKRLKAAGKRSPGLRVVDELSDEQTPAGVRQVMTERKNNALDRFEESQQNRAVTDAINQLNKAKRHEPRESADKVKNVQRLKFTRRPALGPSGMKMDPAERNEREDKLAVRIFSEAKRTDAVWFGDRRITRDQMKDQIEAEAPATAARLKANKARLTTRRKNAAAKKQLAAGGTAPGGAAAPAQQPKVKAKAKGSKQKNKAQPAKTVQQPKSGQPAKTTAGKKTTSKSKPKAQAGTTTTGTAPAATTTPKPPAGTKTKAPTPKAAKQPSTAAKPAPKAATPATPAATPVATTAATPSTTATPKAAPPAAQQTTSKPAAPTPAKAPAKTATQGTPASATPAGPLPAVPSPSAATPPSAANNAEPAGPAQRPKATPPAKATEPAEQPSSQKPAPKAPPKGATPAPKLTTGQKVQAAGAVASSALRVVDSVKQYEQLREQGMSATDAAAEVAIAQSPVGEVERAVESYDRAVESGQDKAEAAITTAASEVASKLPLSTGGPVSTVIGVANQAAHTLGAPQEVTDVTTLAAEATSMPSQVLTAGARSYYNLGKAAVTGDTKGLDRMNKDMKSGGLGTPLQGYAMMAEGITDIASGDDPEKVLERLAKAGKGSTADRVGNWLADKMYDAYERATGQSDEDWQKQVEEINRKTAARIAERKAAAAQRELEGAGAK